MVSVVLALSSVFVVAALAVVTVGARMPTIRAMPSGLEIRHPLFGRTVARERLDLAGSSLVDLASRRDLLPKWRTLGIGLPDRQIGWFRLIGGDKALVFLARERGAVLDVPTRDGYRILLGTDDAAALLAALRDEPARR